VPSAEKTEAIWHGNLFDFAEYGILKCVFAILQPPFYFILERVVQIFSPLGPKIDFLLDSLAKEPLLELYLKTNCQFSLILTIFLQKLYHNVC
jgi:hypothetical protein